MTESKTNEFKPTPSMSRRWLRKLCAEKHNAEFKPFVLETEKYTVKKGCKKCRGTGCKGHNFDNGQPLICKCVKITKEYKKILKNQLEEELKKKSAESKKDDGDFKGFDVIKEEDVEKKTLMEKAIDALPTR